MNFFEGAILRCFEMYSLMEQFLTRNHVIYYLFDCITKLKYYFNRTVLNNRLFTRYLNHYKKIFYNFLVFIYKRKICLA